MFKCVAKVPALFLDVGAGAPEFLGRTQLQSWYSLCLFSCCVVAVLCTVLAAARRAPAVRRGRIWRARPLPLWLGRVGRVWLSLLPPWRGCVGRVWLALLCLRIRWPGPRSSVGLLSLLVAVGLAVGDPEGKVGTASKLLVSRVLVSRDPDAGMSRCWRLGWTCCISWFKFVAIVSSCRELAPEVAVCWSEA